MRASENSEGMSTDAKRPCSGLELRENKEISGYLYTGGVSGMGYFMTVCTKHLQHVESPPPLSIRKDFCRPVVPVGEWNSDAIHVFDGQRGKTEEFWIFTDTFGDPINIILHGSEEEGVWNALLRYNDNRIVDSSYEPMQFHSGAYSDKIKGACTQKIWIRGQKSGMVQLELWQGIMPYDGGSCPDTIFKITVKDDKDPGTENYL